MQNALSSLGINIADYAQMPDNVNVLGGSNTSEEALTELAKALEAGSITGRETTDSTTASGSPLKLESLDSVLKVVTFKESEIVLWKKIPKDRAYNTVEEYNQLSSYGEDRGGFILEGELPPEEDSQYVRRSQFVRFLGVVKSVTHVLTQTRTQINNAIDQESKNGALWILRKLNRSIWEGDSSIIPQSFNGLYFQHSKHDNTNYYGGSLNTYLTENENVIDLRGSSLEEIHIESAAGAIVENNGVATDLFAPPKVISGFVNQFYGQKFILPNSEGVKNAIMGQKVAGHQTSYGLINFNYDIFMSGRKGIDISGAGASATSTNAPNIPVVGGAPVAPVAATVINSLWDSTYSGDVWYAVAAVNRFGRSALLRLDASAATIVANGAADLQFTAGVGGEPATGFEIYRTLPDATSGDMFYKIFEISTSELIAGYNGAAAGKVRDLNYFLPKTEQAFIIENEKEVHEFKQLTPLMKMDLAIIAPAYRFMVLMYGTPMLFAPLKMVRFINIGPFIGS